MQSAQSAQGVLDKAGLNLSVGSFGLNCLSEYLRSDPFPEGNYKTAGTQAWSIQRNSGH